MSKVNGFIWRQPLLYDYQWSKTTNRSSSKWKKLHKPKPLFGEAAHIKQLGDRIIFCWQQRSIFSSEKVTQTLKREIPTESHSTLSINTNGSATIKSTEHRRHREGVPRSARLPVSWSFARGTKARTPRNHRTPPPDPSASTSRAKTPSCRRCCLQTLILQTAEESLKLGASHCERLQQLASTLGFRLGSFPIYGTGENSHAMDVATGDGAEREPSRAFGDASKSLSISPEAHRNRTRFLAMTWSPHERWFRSRIKLRLGQRSHTLSICQPRRLLVVAPFVAHAYFANLALHCTFIWDLWLQYWIGPNSSFDPLMNIV